MKSGLLVFALACAFAPLFAQPIKQGEAVQLGTEAYLYGYPLITMDLTRQVMTNTAAPGNNKAPMGQFYNAKVYPNASFRDVTAPNADTLYSAAWLDVSQEPIVLHVPDESGRYYLMPMLSGWTNVFSSPGTRTTGTKAADFALIGPGWKGMLPAGVKELKSPTNMVWILGRTYSTGTPEDYATVHALQAQYTLTPLSMYGKAYTPPPGKVDPAIDMKTPVRDQVNAIPVGEYFKRLAMLMKNNPPASTDAPMVAKLAKLGIVPGENFDITKLDPTIARGLEEGRQAALAKIQEKAEQKQQLVNGWDFQLQTGQYGTDYLQRAFVTAIGLGANLPQDAIYPFTHVDSQSNPLDGNNSYKIHFDKDKLPPVKGFWSLTMYDKDFFFVDNPLNRYTLSLRNPLKFNPDGSLDLLIQNANPGKEKEANWLPAPKGPFILMFRFYWPEEPLLKGNWHPPAVVKKN